MLRAVLAANGNVPPADIGVALALAGDRKKAFEYLEKAFSEEDSDLVLAVRHPALDSIRSDPRFTNLMRRLGLPE
jgi:hypothetical protein